MSEENKINIDARKIDITKLELEKINIDLSSEELRQIGEQPLNLDIKIKFGIDFERKDIDLVLSIAATFSEENNEGSSKVGLDTRSYVSFHIHNLDDLIIQEEDEKKLPKPLGVTLLSLGFSTVRGVIFEKLSNTSMNGIMLPVINPEELFDHYIKTVESEIS